MDHQQQPCGSFLMHHYLLAGWSVIEAGTILWAILPSALRRVRRFIHYYRTIPRDADVAEPLDAVHPKMAR